MAKKAKLNQIVAVEKSVVSGALKATAAMYHQAQKPEPFKGIARSYQPYSDEASEQLPSESSIVQARVHELNQDFIKTETEMLDLVATKDFGNTQAKADVVIDGLVVLRQAPVSYLLFLEKQMIELRTYVAALPVLDPTEEWHFEENANAYATAPTRTNRTKKVLRNHVKAEATKEHPAQVEVYHEDVNVGVWTTVKYSGMMPQKDKTDMLNRLDELTKAIKYAREQANNTEVEHQKIAEPILRYVFYGSAPTGTGA